jgi:hypothetical protein
MNFYRIFFVIHILYELPNFLSSRKFCKMPKKKFSSSPNIKSLTPPLWAVRQLRTETRRQVVESGEAGEGGRVEHGWQRQVDLACKEGATCQHVGGK